MKMNKDNITLLDGQQIIARKHKFDYIPEIEEQRRFLSRFIDLLLEKEQEILAENGGDMQAIKFPMEDSSLDIHLGIFMDILRQLEDVDFILKEPSFSKHMEQLNCFNWKFYHEEIYPYIFWKKRNFDNE